MKPNTPATHDRNVVIAMRALADGTANAGQQKLALEWIVLKASAMEAISFRLADEGGEAGTAFHEGRRFVGWQISRILTKEVFDEVTKANEAKPK